MQSRHPKFRAPAIGFAGLPGITGIEQLFGELLGGVGAPAASPGTSALAGRCAAPAVNVREEATQFVVEAAVPGLNSDQLTIEFEEGVLTLAGEWRTETDEQREQSVRREMACGAFKRELRFADRVDAEQLAAALQDGILTVTLPKATQALRKQVPID
jgi:HSP20 family protein